jgi:hypothetical protein
MGETRQLIRKQQREDSKKTEAPKKLTEKELERLKKHFQESNHLITKRAFLCLDKEQKIRDINKKFEKEFDHFTVSIEHQNEAIGNYTKQLDQKYGGQHSYNLDTGEIKPV